MKEHNIQNLIRIWCGERDIPCFRCNVGKVETTKGTWFDTGLPPGFSDLIILYNHTVYFCEVKTLKGKQREDQINFMNYVRNHGYTYFVAKSIKDIEQNLGI
jgi:hypothetical protein